jgi:hypothetical protein
LIFIVSVGAVARKIALFAVIIHFPAAVARACFMAYVDLEHAEQVGGSPH